MQRFQIVLKAIELRREEMRRHDYRYDLFSNAEYMEHMVREGLGGHLPDRYTRIHPGFDFIYAGLRIEFKWATKPQLQRSNYSVPFYQFQGYLNKDFDILLCGFYHNAEFNFLVFTHLSELPQGRILQVFMKPPGTGFLKPNKWLKHRVLVSQLPGWLERYSGVSHELR